MGNAGRPPVPPSRAVATTEHGRTVAEQNYLTIVETLKGDRGAGKEALAIRAMFGGDKALADRFLAACFSLLAGNSDVLTKATPMSVVEVIKKSASLGLEVLTDEAGIAVYDGVATLMVMYRGYLKRARNSGQIRAIDAEMVMSGDDFDYGADQNGFWFRHHPAKVGRDADGQPIGERGAYQGAYAYAVMNNGFVHGRYMDIDELNHIRTTFSRVQRSDNPWVTRYPEMCKKTVLRNLVKYLPQEAFGREFLEVEKANDDAIQRLAETTERIDSGLAQVRALALAATGQQPPEESPQEEAPKEEAPAATPPEAPPAEDAQEGPSGDPNVAAAMAEAERQEQLRRQRGR